MYDWQKYIPDYMVANPAQLDIPTADSPGRQLPETPRTFSDFKDQFEAQKAQSPYHDLLSLLKSSPSKGQFPAKKGSSMSFTPQKTMRPASGSLMDILSALYGARYR